MVREPTRSKSSIPVSLAKRRVESMLTNDAYLFIFIRIDIMGKILFQISPMMSILTSRPIRSRSKHPLTRKSKIKPSSRMDAPLPIRRSAAPIRGGEARSVARLPGTCSKGMYRGWTTDTERHNKNGADLSQE